MQVNNYLTDLLDLAISKSWVEFTLEPGKVPYMVASNGTNYLLSGQPKLTTEELSSYLEALDLPESPPTKRPNCSIYYKSETHLKKRPFKVCYESVDSRIPGQPDSFRAKFLAVSKIEPWNPEDES